MSFTVRNRGSEERSAAAAGEVENRRYTRFCLSAPAIIRHEGVIIAGQLVNMSLSGALISSASRIPVHEGVTVTILNGARSDLLNELRATVTRTTEAGWAVRFDRVLLESREAWQVSPPVL